LVGVKADSPDATEFLIALGQRVARRREALAISQRELARRSGLHWSYIATIETGKRNIGVVNAARLATALGYDDVGQLMDGLSLP
jgi:transcriptional regulator with XRE-family HTH domain